MKLKTQTTTSKKAILDQHDERHFLVPYGRDDAGGEYILASVRAIEEEDSHLYANILFHDGAQNASFEFWAEVTDEDKLERALERLAVLEDTVVSFVAAARRAADTLAVLNSVKESPDAE